MRNCELNLEQCDDQLTIQLSGAIDEEFQKPDLSERSASRVNIDFDKVDFINSLGVRGWVHWMRDLQGQFPSAQFEFTNCPVCIVSQMNMLKGFIPQRCEITSLRLPLFCEECEESEDPLFRLGEDLKVIVDGKDVEVEFEPVKCRSCNSKHPMSLDVPAQKYFRFLLHD